MDSPNKALYQINSESKKSQILSGGSEFDGGKLLAADQENIYLLLAKGIFRLKVDTSSPDLIIQKDNDWGEISGLSIFSGNLYLLDKNKNQIWKYIGNGTDFSPKTNYLKDNVNLSQVNSLAVDGLVWVDQNDKILKFIQGNLDNFNIQGLEKPLGTNLKIFTNQTSKYIYILDLNNNRVVLIDKEGKYQQQYKWDNLKDVSNMEIFEDEKKIFLTSGSKIYEFGVK